MTLFNLSTNNLAALFLFNTLVLVASVKIVVDTASSRLYSKYFVHSVLIFLLSYISMQILAEIGTGKLYFAKLVVNFPVYLFIIFDLFLCALEILFAISFINTN